MIFIYKKRRTILYLSIRASFAHPFFVYRSSVFLFAVGQAHRQKAHNDFWFGTKQRKKTTLKNKEQTLMLVINANENEGIREPNFACIRVGIDNPTRSYTMHSFIGVQIVVTLWWKVQIQYKRERVYIWKRRRFDGQKRTSRSYSRVSITIANRWGLLGIWTHSFWKFCNKEYCRN